jgi:hypothetical protein
MTTFAPAQLPSGCNTVEKVNAWSAMVLRAVAGTREVVEQEGYVPQRVAVAPIAETPSSGIRMTTRASLKLRADYDSSTSGKLWTMVEEQVEGTIPVGFTTN